MKLIQALPLLLLASPVAAQDGQYYAPGHASWLGGPKTSPITPDYKDFLPYIYVVYGQNGFPHVRTIIDGDDPNCPEASGPGAQDIDLNNNKDVNNVMKSIINGNPVNNNEMPYKFPVQVCGLTITNESIFRQDMEDGTLRLSYNNKSYRVPAAKSNPKRFLLTGDTGLRSKPTNLGLGKLGDDESKSGGYNCTAPDVYGIKQCYTNFTQSDLSQEQTGSFQSIDDWPFKQLADSAAEENIDVIVYVGDYLYRQGPCPVNNTGGPNKTAANCSALNRPGSTTHAPVSEGITMNFIPGEYGDNWWGWWADFFYPAMKLLQSAPLIPTRGNHEICKRGGYGFFYFLSVVPLEDFCLEYFPPYAIKFEHEQFLVMDDSPINPEGGGVDHFGKGQCPGIPSSGSIVPVQENRYNVTADWDWQNNTYESTGVEVQNQLRIFTEFMETIEGYSQGYESNFYVGHRPLLGIGCNTGELVTLDWTLQQALGPTTLDRISAIITGHMHWLEVLKFENDNLPAQMVVGNGGTKLIDNYITQSSIPYIDLKVGNPKYGIQARVEKGLTMSKFGYGIMERQENNEYNVDFYAWNKEKMSVEKLDDFNLLIPAGLRSSSGDPSDSTPTEEKESASGESDLPVKNETVSSAGSVICCSVLVAGIIMAVIFT